MTGRQVERLKKVKSRYVRAIDNNVIMDVLVEFWEEAILCQEKSINFITGVVWKKNPKGEWCLCRVDERTGVSREKRMTEPVAEGEEKLFEQLQKLNEFDVSRIREALLSNKDSLEEIGYRVISKSEDIGIYII